MWGCLEGGGGDGGGGKAEARGDTVVRALSLREWERRFLGHTGKKATRVFRNWEGKWTRGDFSPGLRRLCTNTLTCPTDMGEGVQLQCKWIFSVKSKIRKK